MSVDQIVRELNHYLSLYAINQKEEYLAGVLTFAGMLAGKVSK